MTKKPDFNEGQFREALARVSEGMGHGDTPAKPDFDPKQHKDVVDAYVQGRDIEDYRPALERFGFKYWPADVLNKRMPMGNGQTHRDGQWRSVQMRMGFTSDEICAHFPGGPPEFAVWLERQIMSRRARQSGLVLPS